MITTKTIIGVIIVAMLVGVLYVLFEKNFSGTQSLSNSQSVSIGEKMQPTTQQTTPAQSSMITLPSSEPVGPPIDGSSNLLQEAEDLQMRDYSTYFEELKEKTKQ